MTQPACTDISPEELIAALQTSTADVFHTMLALDLTPGSPYTRKTAGSVGSGVVALVGLAGAWVGSGSLYCGPRFACRMASALLMSDFDAVNEDVLDAVAEVANMVIGNVKTLLEEHVGPMGLSTPTVIFGRNFETRSAAGQEWTIVPFQSEADRLYVQLSLAPNGGRAGAFSPGFPLPHTLGL